MNGDKMHLKSAFFDVLNNLCCFVLHIYEMVDLMIIYSVTYYFLLRCTVTSDVSYT